MIFERGDKVMRFLKDHNVMNEFQNPLSLSSEAVDFQLSRNWASAFVGSSFGSCKIDSYLQTLLILK